MIIALYMTGIGIILSLPSLVIFTFAHRQLSRIKVLTAVKKSILCLLGIVLIAGSFYLLKEEYTLSGNKESRMIIGSYVLVFLMSALILNAHFNEHFSEKKSLQQHTT